MEMQTLPLVVFHIISISLISEKAAYRSLRNSEFIISGRSLTVYSVLGGFVCAIGYTAGFVTKGWVADAGTYLSDQWFGFFYSFLTYAAFIAISLRWIDADRNPKSNHVVLTHAQQT